MLSLHMKKGLVAATTNSGRGLLKVLVEANHDCYNRDWLFLLSYKHERYLVTALKSCALVLAML